MALADLTLQVPRGIVFGLLGPNGIGKTTTIPIPAHAADSNAEVLGYDMGRHAAEVPETDGTTNVIATDLRAVQTGVAMPASHDWL